MKQWAVCYTTQTSPIRKWTVITAESARKAAETVRACNSLCSIHGVYKFVEEWRWS